MIYYFAYGSNMDENHLNDWCSCKKYKPITFKNPYPAKLEPYKLCFNYYSAKNWQAGAANIMLLKGNCVYGLLICLNGKELETIRDKEGCKNPKQRGYPNNYDEITVDVVQLDTGRKVSNVITYKAARYKEEKKCQPPAKSYMQLIITNAKKYKFPTEYIKCLESIETKKGN